MNFENLILIVIFCVLGYMIFKQGQKPEKIPHKIKFISQKTGQVVEMNLLDATVEELPAAIEFDETAFLENAKIAFGIVMDAFTSGNIAILKSLLTPDVFFAFSQEIEQRKKENQTVDFSFICFDKVEILNRSKSKGEVTVRFISEQINLLKDKDGNVIEGDAMSVATATDVWTFKKSGRAKWLVSATKSGAEYV